MKTIDDVENLKIDKSDNGIRNGYKVNCKRSTFFPPLKINEGDNIVIEYENSIYYFIDIYWPVIGGGLTYNFSFMTSNFKKFDNREKLIKKII